MEANLSDHPIVHEETEIPDINRDDDDGSSVNDTNKRPRSSEIWNYFQKIDRGSELESQMAKCSVPKCKSKPYSCGKSATTNSLWRHLQNSHWNIYVNAEEYQRRKKKTTGGESLDQFLKVLYNSHLR